MPSVVRMSRVYAGRLPEGADSGSFAGLADFTKASFVARARRVLGLPGRVSGIEPL